METTTIDRAALDRVLDSVGGDAEFLGELLTAYFEDSPAQIAAMHAAVAAGDAEALRRAAHSQKSTSANFGATALAEQCRQLEAMAKAGVLDGAAARIAEIEVAYEKARAALQAIQSTI